MVQSFLDKIPFGKRSQNKRKNRVSPRNKNQDYSSTITVIGPRSSGKTTYLSGLAYFPQRKLQPYHKLQFDVTVGDDKDSQRLLTNVKNLLQQGTELPPSKDVVNYSFTIEINNRGKKEIITLQAKDFPGEGLDNIDQEGSKYRLHLEERLTAKFNNFLILVSDWEPPNSDVTLSEKILIFKQIAKNKCNSEDLKELKFAVVMNKCERGELWTSRLTPEQDIFDRYLRDTADEFRKFIKEFDIPSQNLKFFAMSTFGVRGDDDPRPNRKDIIKAPASATEKEQRSSVLIDSQAKWQPYGMLSPIYWLTTGRSLSDGV